MYSHSNDEAIQWSEHALCSDYGQLLCPSIEVKDLQTAGIIALLLPPHSPDLNPIEEAFNYIKKYLRKHDDVLQAVNNPTDVMQAAFDSITNH